MKVPLSGRRVGRTLIPATLVCLVTVAVVAPAVASSRVPSTPRIKNLAKQAYIWGLAPEFVYRFEKYNDLVTAEVNTLGGGSGVAAAWNNNATNAGDASVLYLNSMMDLSGKQGRGGVKELVMTVPPSSTDYYVVNLLDSFINTVGSIGTRTTPSSEPQTYLIAGPRSQVREAALRGDRRFPVPGHADRHEPQLDAHPDPRELARGSVRSHLDGRRSRPTWSRSSP